MYAFGCMFQIVKDHIFKDPGTALMETKPNQVYTNENRL